MFVSVGKLEYGGTDRLVLNIDEGIGDYYYSLIPKWKVKQRPAYDAKITVIRTGIEKPISRWMEFDGQFVPFVYSGVICEEETYYILKAWSKELCKIRIAHGLPPFRVGYDCFHITIGNKKCQ